MKRGFTVLELMIAISIFTVVVGSLCGTVVGIQRLITRSYAEAELSIRVRALREKLLFHVAPPHDGKAYSGLLSGAAKSSRPVEGNQKKIYLRANAIQLANGASADQTIELVREQTSGGASVSCFKNDGDRDPWRTHWLRLAGMGAGRTEVANLGYLGTDAVVDDLLSVAPNRNLYFIRLNAKLGGVEHRERLSIPVFGKEQIKNQNAVFHDNLLQ